MSLISRLLAGPSSERDGYALCDEAAREIERLNGAIAKLSELASVKTEAQIMDELGFPWGPLVLGVIDAASGRQK